MRLTKHHGLGNDFLVLVDLENELTIDSALAIAVCDRRRGIGADGLMRVSPGSGGADLTMELLNSDGSRAEMSGNGMRCLAQAVVMAGAVSGSDFTVATPGGIRTVEHRIGDLPGQSWVSVDMGVATRSEVSPDSVRHLSEPRRTATIDIGNPHVVLLVDEPNDVELGALGPGYESQFPEGANVEWVTQSGPDALRLRVWERGAGVTQACGTGACASAMAAHQWGLVGTDVEVSMPGGTVSVTLGETVTLAGAATYVAEVSIEPEFLGSTTGLVCGG